MHVSFPKFYVDPLSGFFYTGQSLGGYYLYTGIFLYVWKKRLEHYIAYLEACQ